MTRSITAATCMGCLSITDRGGIWKLPITVYSVDGLGSLRVNFILGRVIKRNYKINIQNVYFKAFLGVRLFTLQITY